jgi:CelD/BcsL family acetyltransferase involved in cellulose biosynthesis
MAGAAAERQAVASPEAGLRIETVSSEADLARLAGSWDELVHAMPRPSPFLLHGWLLEWWRHYGGDDQLTVHVAYRGSRLVGALPLCIRRRHGLRVSEFVGGTWAALADLMVAPGEETSAAGALAERAVSSGHDFANLFGLPGSSRLVAALSPDALRLVERLEAPVLDLDEGWDVVYRAKMSSKKRSERRRRWRQLEALGTLEASVARTADELEPAIEDAFRVYALRWQGRRDASGFITPTGLRFHRVALLRLAEVDVPRIVTIRLDGRPVAFALSMHLSGRAYGVTMAFDPAYARFGPGAEAKLLSLEAAGSEGIARVELLGHAADHKQRFTDRFEPIYQGIGLARTLRGRAAAEALVGGIRVRRAIKRSRTAQRVYYRVPTLGRIRGRAAGLDRA